MKPDLFERQTCSAAMKAVRGFSGLTSNGVVEAFRRGGVVLSSSQSRAIFARQDKANIWRGVTLPELAAFLAGVRSLFSEHTKAELVAAGWLSLRAADDGSANN